MPPLGKHTHTKTEFSNMVGSYFHFPREMQVLIRLKVHIADIAEYTFNFLTSKSWFSRGYISVIIFVCFLNIVIRFFRMPSNFPSLENQKALVYPDRLFVRTGHCTGGNLIKTRKIETDNRIYLWFLFSHVYFRI